jgi:hypothetical protein
VELATCRHCGALLPRRTAETDGLPDIVVRVLEAVRGAGDLSTPDVALVCRLELAEAENALEVLRDGLGLIGRHEDGAWLPWPDPRPSPATSTFTWRARGIVGLERGPGPAPLPWAGSAIALPRVSRAVVGRLRRGGVLGAGDLHGIASREGLRRALRRLADDGWVACDLGLRRRGTVVQLWRLLDVPPIDV